MADEEPTSTSKQRIRDHAARERESIERIKARAIANGTMRADPELTIRRVDPATLRPPKPAPAPSGNGRPKEEPVSMPARPVERAALDAAGLPDDEAEVPPSSESLRGRPGRGPGKGGYAPPTKEKTCRRCNLPFVPRSGNQRYCDREECRTRECELDGCEVRFEINPARPKQRFHSLECSNLAQRKDRQAPDSNPEQEPEALPGAPGPRGPSSDADLPDHEPDPDSRAKSPIEAAAEDELDHQEPSSAGSSASSSVGRDSSQEAADTAVEADRRYVELLYTLVESEGKQVPAELRGQALEQLHEMWADRAVNRP